MTEKFRLTRRRLLGSVLSVGAATAGAGAGTMALFSDTETSSGNSISMGTLDLVLTESGYRSESTQDGVSGALTIPDDAHPGSTLMGTIKLHSTGSLTTSDADQVLDIDFSVSTADPDRTDDEGDTLEGAEKMAEQFRVESLRYNPNWDGVSPTEEDDIGTPVFLDELTGDLPELTGLKPPRTTAGPTPTIPEFYIELEWADDADYDFTYSNNAYQGDEMDITITFTLRQVTN